MKSWKQKTFLMWSLVAAMLLLLPLLAVLQYRWLGEVSQAERERMQANLRVSAEKLCADFDRELTNIYVQFQSQTLPNSDLLAIDFASRYRRWLASAPDSKLVSDIYRIFSGEDGSWKLVKFNASSNSFDEVEWPEKLLSIRNRFESEVNAEAVTQNVLRGIFRQNNETSDWPLPKGARGIVFQLNSSLTAADVPALIIPDTTHAGPDIQALIKGKRAFTIAVLDTDVIRREIVPPLIRRYFSADSVDQYNLAIIRRGNLSEAVYQSDANLPLKAFEQTDTRSSLFKIRTEELDRIFVATGKLPALPLSLEPKSATEESGEPAKSKTSRVAVKVLQSEVQVANGVGSKPVGNQAQKIELHRPFTSSLDNEGGWQLLVKHRAGSLDAAVANVRRRNLSISFGVLLLLAGSVGFIVLSSRRAERLAKQQMEFVAGVSHELRTPLAVICSAAENLADGVIDSREQIKRYGGLIRDEGRRLSGMVEQVLEFAGAQSGRKTYELRPTDLNQVIEDAVAACHMQLVEGGFELETNLASNGIRVNADAAALSRAIQNLLSNAMKYSGGSRWIGLNVKTVQRDGSEAIQIKVSDQGLGIQPSELPHIFEPFYRGKEVVASQIHGNGLGLSLVKHIVDAHQGEVTVESVVKQGSQFNLILPQTSKQELVEKFPQEIYEQTNPAR